MSNEVNKVLLAISGSSEARHLEYIEEFLDLHEGEGYETYVVSPQVPSQAVDHYVPPTMDNLQSIVEKIKSPEDGNDEVVVDELVIYVTGHGGMVGENSVICLDGECNYDNVASWLDSIVYGQRTVIMAPCYGWNWINVFRDDPRTGFMSAGSKDETVRGAFSSHLVSSKVKNLNKDKEISWLERFNYAAKNNQYGSIPFFVATPGYVQAGKPPFSNEIIEVTNNKTLKKKLKKLNYGQYAVIWFSSGDSNLDQMVDDQARKSGGQHLWLKTGNAELAAEYGVDTPAAVVINNKGQTNVVEDLTKIDWAIAQFELPSEQIVMEKINIAVNLKGKNACDHAVRDTARYFEGMEVNENTKSIYKDVFEAVKEMNNRKCKEEAIIALVGVLERMEFEGEKELLFEKLITEAKRLEGLRSRAGTLTTIAEALGKTGFKEKAVAVYMSSIEVAEMMSFYDRRTDVLKQIMTSLSLSGLQDEAVAVVKRLIPAATSMENYLWGQIVLAHISQVVSGGYFEEEPSVEIQELLIQVTE